MAVMTALAIGAGVSAIGGAVGAHAAGKRREELETHKPMLKENQKRQKKLELQ